MKQTKIMFPWLLIDMKQDRKVIYPAVSEQ
jgi:hypothetical protein